MNKEVIDRFITVIELFNKSLEQFNENNKELSGIIKSMYAELLKKHKQIIELEKH